MYTTTVPIFTPMRISHLMLNVSFFFIVLHHFKDAVCVSGDSVNTDWKTKCVKEWESSDILCWIISIADDRDIAVSQFNDIDGNTLCNMSERDFIFRESRHGQFLCSELQKLKLQQECQQIDTVNKCKFFAQCPY
jgi:hypothetical protein